MAQGTLSSINSHIETDPVLKLANEIFEEDFGYSLKNASHALLKEYIEVAREQFSHNTQS